MALGWNRTLRKNPRVDLPVMGFWDMNARDMVVMTIFGLSSACPTVWRTNYDRIMHRNRIESIPEDSGAIHTR